MNILKPFYYLVLAAVIGNTNLFAQFGFGQNEEIVKTKMFQSFNRLQAGGELKVAVKVNIGEDWHINSDKPKEDFLIATNFELGKVENFTQTFVKYPNAEDLKFDFSDVPVSVFQGEFLIGMIIKISESAQLGDYKLPFTFTYQACNNQSCMAPFDILDTLKISIVDKSAAILEQNGEIFSGLDLTYTASGSAEPEEDSLAKTLNESGWLFGLILIFLGGLALNLTPCVYPLIPITIGFFGGQSQGSTKKLFFLGILYVLGLSLTYSIVGVVTSLSGAVFGTLLQNPIVIIIIVLIFIGLALSQFGVYEFKLPDKLVMKAGGAKSGMYGAFFMGLTMGIVAAPCIGPFVIGLVTVVAAKGDPFYGFIMFFTLAVGLGTPYLFLAIFSGKIKSLPRAGEWMEGVEHMFGLILLGAALYFAGPLIPKEINFFILPIYAIFSALFLLFIDKKGNNIINFRVIKSVFSIVLIALSIWALWPSEEKSPDWKYFTEEDYQASLDSNNKMLIDFYADWCIPCKELDALTFSNEDIIELSKDFDNYKVDMTKTMSDETEKIRNKFKILGMPTVLIIDSEGKEIERLTGFVSAEELIEIIAEVK